MKRIPLTIVLSLIVFVLGYVSFVFIVDILPEKIESARVVREKEAEGAIVVQEGTTKIIQGISVSLDFVPVVQGDIVFTVDGKEVFVSGGDALIVGDHAYDIHVWGIGNDVWAALTLEK